jgi:hypothetical protein
MRKVLVALIAVAACGCGASLAQLREKASPDLGCAEHRLQVVVLDDHEVLVRGCDQEAVYDEKSGTNLGIIGFDCVWQLRDRPRAQR